jgi:uncharacterized protein YbjT (DUF2867 family)
VKIEGTCTPIAVANSSMRSGLVAGAAGYLGTELTKQLLDRGYIVRATVRSDTPKQTGFLRALATALPGKLEIVEADLDKDGSYDEIVQGATYVYAPHHSLHRQ